MSNKNVIPLKIITALLIFGSPLISFAQNVPQDSIPAITLDEVVVAVNKVTETKRNIAQQIDILNASQISTSQSQTTADLLAGAGNVFIQKSQLGGGSTVIRGFEANRTLLVVDGVRMNNIIYRSGHLQNIVTIDNNALDRVEILFGPSSTLYGSDALGGVISMYTKVPIFNTSSQKQQIKANTLSRYGSVNNEYTNHVDVNWANQRWASLSSITNSNFGDLKGGQNQNPFYSVSYGERPYYAERIGGKDSLLKNNNRYLQVKSAYSQFDLLQKFLFKQNSHLVHGLNLQYSNSSDVPRYDRLTDPADNGLKYAEWYYGPQKRLLAAYDLNFSNKASFFQNVHAGLNYQSIEESRHTRKFGKNNLQNRIEKVNLIGVNIDFNKSVRHHALRFGIDAQYNKLKSTANELDIVSGLSSSLDTRYPDGENNMTNAAVYISHSWKISNQLVLTDGLRLGLSSLHARFVDTNFFHLPYNKADQKNTGYSGSIGLINTPSDDLKLSLLISTGFRTPNVDDLSKVFESAPGKIIVPNKDLKPEKTINYELGVTKIFNKKTSWESVFYYTDFIDAIVTSPFIFNGKDSVFYQGANSQVLANQNQRKAYIFGFSSNVKSQCSDYLSLNLGMNFTYGRIKTDSADAPLDHIPPFMMHLQATYTNKKFSSDFTIHYNSRKKLTDYYLNGEDNEQYAPADGMPAWLTANLHLAYEYNKHLKIQSGVDNIFDTQYRSFASGINAPGRNIFVAIRFSY